MGAFIESLRRSSVRSARFDALDVFSNEVFTKRLFPSLCGFEACPHKCVFHISNVVFTKPLFPRLCGFEACPHKHVFHTSPLGPCLCFQQDLEHYENQLKRRKNLVIVCQNEGLSVAATPPGQVGARPGQSLCSTN